jgi:replicative superfamily II helicase
LGVHDSDRPGEVLRKEKEKALKRGDQIPTQVSQKKILTQREKMDEVCYHQCIRFVKDQHQVLVFVHSRNATGLLARTFIDKAVVNNQRELFTVDPARAVSSSYLKAKKAVSDFI